MCNKRRVVVTGAGVISPVGNSKKAFWDALLRGESGAGPLTTFNPSKFTTTIAAEVKGFDPSKYFSSKEARHMDRFVQFGIVCAEEAVKDSGLDLNKINRNRAGVLVGSGIGGLHTFEKEHLNYLEKGPSRISPFLIPMLIVNMASGEISIKLGFKGPNSCVATACASSNHAIGDALKIIQRGDADIMVTFFAAIFAALCR